MDEARGLFPEYAREPGDRFWMRLDSQTSGRGRRGASWKSPASEGIYLTYASRLNCPLGRLQGLSLVAGIKISELLSQFGCESYVKWPNDIYAKQLESDQYLKIAGLLVETKCEGSKVSELFLGIGLNYSRIPPFGSILDSSTNPPTKSEVVSEIISRFTGLETELQTNGLKSWIGRWEKTSFMLGREVEFFEQNEKTTSRGRVVGLSERGELKLETKGQCRFLNPDSVSGFKTLS